MNYEDDQDEYNCLEEEKQTPEEVKKDNAVKEEYSYIVKWGRIMQSFDYYIINQCHQAKADNASKNAVYERDGVWVTTYDIQNEVVRKQMGLPN